MLELYTNPMSRGRIARWMLEEIGEPYEVNYVAYGDEMHSDSFLSLNPMGKVPALVHDGAVVTETPAICVYLADTFAHAGLHPADDERAAYYRWMFFAAGPLEAATTNKSLGLNPDPERGGMLGYGSFERMFETLLTAFENKNYLCGDHFTAADVYVGASVEYGMRFNTLPDHPVLAAYRDRVCTRPAHQRATELDDAALNAASN